MSRAIFKIRIKDYENTNLLEILQSNKSQSFLDLKPHFSVETDW